MMPLLILVNSYPNGKFKMLSVRSVYGNQKGLVLPVALVFLVVLGAMGAAAVQMTGSDLKITGNYKNSTEAFYIAEAGWQRALGSLNTVTNWIGSLSNPTTDAFPGDNALGNGNFVVQVFQDDPNPGQVRIRSTGTIAATNSMSVAEAVVSPDFFPIFDYATFACGNLTLKEGVNNLISGGDVFVSGNLDLDPSGTHQIQNGDAFALGDINIQGSSSITGGNAYANGNINLTSSASPNIGGNATAGGNITGSGTVSGTQNQNTSPLPVADLCIGTELANIAVTADVIQGFRDNADTTINGNYTVNGGSITYTGVVHITGNFELSGDVVFSDNVVFVVDGNAKITGPGSLTSSTTGAHATFFVPYSDFTILGGGNVVLDGRLHVGTVNADGSNISGGNVKTNDGANLTVNGNIIATNGNMDASSGGALTVNYEAPTDSLLLVPGSYSPVSWRQVMN
jgi:hypothetical protein